MTTTSWRAKAAAAIVVLGVASLIFSLLSPAKKRLSRGGPASVGVRQPQRSGFRDFLKLRSDPSRRNNGPRKDKRKQRIRISTEPPSNVDLTGGPSRLELGKKIDKLNELRVKLMNEAMAAGTIKNKEPPTTTKTKPNRDKQVPAKFEAEPQEHAMMEALELASDAPPRTKVKLNKKKRHHMRTISKPLPKPQHEVNSLEDVATLVGGRVSKTRLTSEGQIDWSFYEAIELYHTRKAGGTSLYAWAKQVAQKHGLEVHQQEGNCFDPRDARYVQRRVFIFTSLRPPVERALSSYEYDVVQMSNFQNFTLLEFYDRANEVNNHGHNQRDVWQYQKYLSPTKRKRKRRKKTGKKVSRGWVWQCATNCYSKWFGGWPTANLEADTHTAARELDHLEVVWMKNFDNPEYMDWLLHRWNATDIPVPQKRKTADRAKHKYADQDMQVLNEANQKDQWLYEALRRKWSRITNLTLV